jgi:hypothetical protein
LREVNGCRINGPVENADGTLCGCSWRLYRASSKTESIYTDHVDLQRLGNSGILVFRQRMEIVGTALLSELTVELLNRVPAKPLPT